MIRQVIECLIGIVILDTDSIARTPGHSLQTRWLRELRSTRASVLDGQMVRSSGISLYDQRGAGCRREFSILILLFTPCWRALYIYFAYSIK